jgi:putative ABC transport system substrate-binding protein
MSRRAFLRTLAGSLLAAPLAAEAQQPERIYSIGGLTVGTPPTPEERAQSPFLATLRELGWVEGRNIVFDDRRSATVEQLDVLAAELVRLKVDVVYARGTPATRAAKRATSGIPIVMVVGVDPVEDGLVASLSRPGGNVSGVTALSSELIGKRLELLKELLPRVTSIAYMWNPANPGNVSGSNEIRKVAPTIGFRVEQVPVRGPGDFDSAFSSMTKEHVGALVTAADEMLALHRVRLVTLAAKYQPSSHSGATPKPAVSSPIQRTGVPCTNKPAFWSTRSSEEPSRRTYPWSSLRSSNS